MRLVENQLNEEREKNLQLTSRILELESELEQNKAITSRVKQLEDKIKSTEAKYRQTKKKVAAAAPGAKKVMKKLKREGPAKSSRPRRRPE